MSSFKGDDLFGSGPHRFSVGEQGRRVISNAAIAGSAAADGSATYGDRELRIAVAGRLVASSESALWSLRDAIVSEAASTESEGTLTDGNGRSWDDVYLFGFTPDGDIDRGRVFSLGYSAEFGFSRDS